MYSLYIPVSKKKIFKGSITRCWEHQVNNSTFIFKMLIHVILAWCLICNIGHKDCKPAVKLTWTECSSALSPVVCQTVRISVRPSVNSQKIFFFTSSLEHQRQIKKNLLLFKSYIFDSSIIHSLPLIVYSLYYICRKCSYCYLITLQ